MKKLLLTLIVTLTAMIGYSQITTSTMAGKVVDAEGVALIGASVVSTHEPSGSVYGTITNASGFYTIPGARVGGPYKIEVSYVGYEPTVQLNVYNNLGGTTVVDFTLSESGVVVDELVISGDRNAAFGDEKTGASLNLSKDVINSLPTISRSINDFTRMTPQSSGNSFAGTSSRFNNYTIDGNIYNNNFGLGSGQFAGGSPISLDAIEQVSVNLAPYDVRYSGFTGAAVNAVTKSGTNEFEASAYYLFRNDQMIGSKAGDIAVDPGNSSNIIYGARVGGPIIKNKLFFFASFEQESTATPGLQKRAAREGETPDGLTISRVPLSEALFVQESLMDIYGYDTGAPDSYDFASEQTRFNVKLDYNISRKHKASFRFNNYTAFTDVPTNRNSIRFISTRYRNTSRQGVENINFRNNNYTNDRTVRSYVADLNSVISDKISNKFNVGFTQITDPKRGVPGGQDFPFIEVLEPDDSGNLLYYMSMGNELFTVGNLLENNIFNVTNNTTFYMNRHTITAGVNFEYMTFDNAFNPVFNGFYRFNSYQNFVDAVINQDPNVYPDAFAKSFALDGSTTPPTDNTRFGQLGVYGQDEFQMNDKLKLTAGLRIDLPFYPVDIPSNDLLDEKNKTFTDGDGNEFVPDVSVFPTVNPLFSPRLGFNYDVQGDNKTILRGGTGIFSGRIPFVWLSNQVNGSGVIRGGIGYEGQEVVDANIVFNEDVTAYAPADPANSLSNELNLTDRNFRLPQVWRTNLAIDQKLPLGINATVEFMYNRDVSTPIAYNPVLRDPEGTLSGPDERPYWIDQEGLSGYSNDEDFRNVFLLTNAQENADYYSLTGQLSKAFDNGFYAMGAYTLSQARDLDASGGSQAISLWPVNVATDRNNPELGFAAFDQPNRAIGNLSYTTSNTTIGIFYEGGNAGRFSYSYSGSFGDNSNRLMYIPNNASELTFEEFELDGELITADRQAELLDAYIDQDAALSGNRGTVAARNSGLRPWLHRFDLRLLQDVTFTKMGKNRLQLSLDFINVGNLINSNWGVPMVENQDNLLNLREITDAGVPVYRLNTIPGSNEFPTTTFRNTSNVLGNVWMLQAGVRYIFN